MNNRKIFILLGILLALLSIVGMGVVLYSLGASSFIEITLRGLGIIYIVEKGGNYLESKGWFHQLQKKAQGSK